MPKHEFGMMHEEPSYKMRFDVYEPQKYNCIFIDDDFIEPILEDCQSIDCYYHTRQMPGKGINYCGITLIPPESLESFIKILSAQYKAEYDSLISLANKAKENHKYLIHFGI